MFFIVQEIPIPRFNRRMEQRCKYNHFHTIVCNNQVLFLLNQCNIINPLTYKLCQSIKYLFNPKRSLKLIKLLNYATHH